MKMRKKRKKMKKMKKMRGGREEEEEEEEEEEKEEDEEEDPAISSITVTGVSGWWRLGVVPWGPKGRTGGAIFSRKEGRANRGGECVLAQQGSVLSFHQIMSSRGFLHNYDVSLQNRDCVFCDYYSCP